MFVAHMRLFTICYPKQIKHIELKLPLTDSKRFSPSFFEPERTPILSGFSFCFFQKEKKIPKIDCRQF
jgi:hypothetical protein